TSLPARSAFRNRERCERNRIASCPASWIVGDLPITGTVATWRSGGRRSDGDRHVAAAAAPHAAARAGAGVAWSRCGGDRGAVGVRGGDAGGGAGSRSGGRSTGARGLPDGGRRRQRGLAAPASARAARGRRAHRRG